MQAPLQPVEPKKLYRFLFSDGDVVDVLAVTDMASRTAAIEHKSKGVPKADVPRITGFAVILDYEIAEPVRTRSRITKRAGS